MLDFGFSSLGAIRAPTSRIISSNSDSDIDDALVDIIDQNLQESIVEEESEVERDEETTSLANGVN